MRGVWFFEDVAGLDDQISSAVDEDAHFVFVGFDGEVAQLNVRGVCDGDYCVELAGEWHRRRGGGRRSRGRGRNCCGLAGLPVDGRRWRGAEEEVAQA